MSILRSPTKTFHGAMPERKTHKFCHFGFHAGNLKYVLPFQGPSKRTTVIQVVLSNFTKIENVFLIACVMVKFDGSLSWVETPQKIASKDNHAWKAAGSLTFYFEASTFRLLSVFHYISYYTSNVVHVTIRTQTSARRLLVTLTGDAFWQAHNVIT